MINAYKSDPFLRSSEIGLQIWFQNQDSGLVVSSPPSEKRISPNNLGKNPLNTKMNKGFFPNTSKNLLHAPLISLNSIK